MSALPYFSSHRLPPCLAVHRVARQLPPAPCHPTDTQPPAPSRPSTLSCRSYQHFCRCGRSLDARLEALGGARLAPRADINREDWPAIDAWIEGVLEGLAGLPLKSLAELGGAAVATATAAEGTGAATATAPAKRCGIGRLGLLAFLLRCARQYTCPRS